MGPQLWFQGAPRLFPLGSQGCQILALIPQDLTSAQAGCGGEKSIFGCVQPVPLCTLYDYTQIHVGYIGLLSLGGLQAQIFLQLKRLQNLFYKMSSVSS